MKKFLHFFLISLFCAILLSCQQGPSQDEVLQLSGKRYQGMYEFLLSQEYQGTKKAEKIDDKKLFACTVETNYVRTLGLAGYVRDCPEEQCHKDKEYIVIRDYLIVSSNFAPSKFGKSKPADFGKSKSSI